MADWRLEGPYMKNCNCDPGCPCNFNANPTHGNCEGMAAMIVERGHFDDVDLAGVKWAFKYWWPGALHECHGAGQPILDASMSPEQMEAMGAICASELWPFWCSKVHPVRRDIQLVRQTVEHGQAAYLCL